MYSAGRALVRRGFAPRPHELGDGDRGRPFASRTRWSNEGRCVVNKAPADGTRGGSSRGVWHPQVRRQHHPVLAVAYWRGELPALPPYTSDTTHVPIAEHPRASRRTAAAHPVMVIASRRFIHLHAELIISRPPSSETHLIAVSTQPGSQKKCTSLSRCCRPRGARRGG